MCLVDVCVGLHVRRTPSLRRSLFIVKIVNQIDQLYPVFDFGFPINIEYMIFHGFDRDKKFLLDITVALARDQQADDFHLSGRDPVVRGERFPIRRGSPIDRMGEMVIFQEGSEIKDGRQVQRK